MTNIPKNIGPITEELIKFLGYDLVKIGWEDVTDEDGATKWQMDNKEWLNRINWNTVGWFFVNVKENYIIPAEYLNIFENIKYPYRRYTHNWNVVMDIITKIEMDFKVKVIIYPHSILETAKECLKLIRKYGGANASITKNG